MVKSGHIGLRRKQPRVTQSFRRDGGRQALGDGSCPDAGPAAMGVTRACPVLAECESQQTGAQQHEAGRGQCKESVGDQIVAAHDTPSTLDARPN